MFIDEIINNYYKIYPISIDTTIKYIIIGDGFNTTTSFTTEDEAKSAIIKFLTDHCIWSNIDGYKNSICFPISHTRKIGLMPSRKIDELNDFPYCQCCGKKIVYFKDIKRR